MENQVNENRKNELPDDLKQKLLEWGKRQFSIFASLIVLTGGVSGYSLIQSTVREVVEERVTSEIGVYKDFFKDQANDAKRNTEDVIRETSRAQLAADEARSRINELKKGTDDALRAKDEANKAASEAHIALDSLLEFAFSVHERYDFLNERVNSLRFDVDSETENFDDDLLQLQHDIDSMKIQFDDLYADLDKVVGPGMAKSLLKLQEIEDGIAAVSDTSNAVLPNTYEFRIILEGDDIDREVASNISSQLRNHGFRISDRTRYSYVLNQRVNKDYKSVSQVNGIIDQITFPNAQSDRIKLYDAEILHFENNDDIALRIENILLAEPRLTVKSKRMAPSVASKTVQIILAHKR